MSFVSNIYTWMIFGSILTDCDLINIAYKFYCKVPTEQYQIINLIGIL